MTTQPRLFARTREHHNDYKQLSPENFIIAWLDIYTDDNRLRHEYSQRPNYHYYRASTVNDCIDLITQSEAENACIILIIANRFLDVLQHNLLEIVPQVSHVYLFDSLLCNQIFSNDRRFRGTFNDVHSLVTKVDHDIAEVRKPLHMARGIKFITENDAEFFWYRFFFNVLNHRQYTGIARRELLSYLRGNYCGNMSELENIDEYERDYEYNRAIWWYTRESFLYRSMNKVLHVNDINELFLWRPYIKDLDEKLRELRSEQENLTSMFLFRGQRLHINDIKQLKRNVGKLIIMPSFLSTSFNQNVALDFAKSPGNPDSMRKPVILRINVNANETTAIFADIQSHSYFAAEEECLFSLRSLFRINRVEYSDDLWHIDLTVADENDQEFCKAINPWKASIGEQSFFAGRRQPLFTRYLTVENSSFLAFQLLIDLMLRLNQTSFALEEMMEMCRIKYADSPSDLNKIDEFERTYLDKHAIKWYTTDSFLYRLLNQSLRLEDIDTLFKLRYYIYDLHNQLAQLQIPYVASLPTDRSILTLYRGQRMSITELNKLRENVAKLISKNSFLSTTSNITAAVFFSGDGSLDNLATEVSVLYQITVDTKISHAIPFAKIDYLSVYDDEDEVLFSMAAVFQIDQVEQYGNLWVVDLTLINKEDEEWNKLTAHLNK